MLDFTVGRGRASFGIQSTRRARGFAALVVITATSAPTGLLFKGDNAQDDLGNFSTYNGAGNYSSSAAGGTATINAPVYRINGSPAAVDTVLDIGDVPDWLVTDSEGNTEVFALPAVQYLALVLKATGNEVEIDINPNVPDAKSLGDLVIPSPGPYADTYTGVTAGALRNGVYNFGAVNNSGLPQISGTTGLGDTLTRIPGLWSTPTGTLTFADAWQSDGSPISGETGATLTITEDEQGTDVTIKVTGDDGVNSPVMAESLATSIPSGAVDITITQINSVDSTAINQNTHAPNFNGIAAVPGQIALVVYGYCMFGHNVANTPWPLNMTFGGSPGTQIMALDDGENDYRFRLLYAKTFDVSAGGDFAFSASLYDAANMYWGGWSRRVYLISKSDGSVPSVSLLSNDFQFLAGAPVDLSANVTAGTKLLGVGRSLQEPAGGTGPVFTGLTADSTGITSGDNKQKTHFFSADITADESPRTMTMSDIDSTTGWNFHGAILEIS